MDAGFYGRGLGRWYVRMTCMGKEERPTSGRRIARNSMWNIAGQLLPMVVALVAIPPTIRGLGVPRFGVLSLAWIVLGYFSLFDLGISRALTKLVADKIGAQEEAAIPPLAWTSLLCILALGIIGGGVALALARWLVYDALKVPPDLQAETLNSFYLLAAATPIVTLTSGLRGILEALHEFRLLNLIRIPMSVFSFVGALLVLPFSRSLVWVVAVLICGRVVGAAAHLVACLRCFPALRQFAIGRETVGPVLRFGGWMTVTNVVGPLMVYLDRFVLGALLSVGMVAYYTAPFDMITRVLLISAAVAGVLFPAFASTLAEDPARAAVLLNRGVKFMALAAFPVMLVVSALAPEGLRLWLGPVFSQNGTPVLRWLAMGCFVNSLAQMPFAYIQSAGRPDITAALHLSELPIYLAAVWWLTLRYGIEGTAAAWTLRVIADAILLCGFAERSLPRHSNFLARSLAIMAAAGIAIGLVALPGSFPARLVITILALLAFALGGWFWALGAKEREILVGMLPASEGNVRQTATR